MDDNYIQESHGVFRPSDEANLQKENTGRGSVGMVVSSISHTEEWKNFIYLSFLFYLSDTHHLNWSATILDHDALNIKRKK